MTPAPSINRAMNIVIPIDTPAGPAFVHSTPIGRAVFELYYMEISTTFRHMQEGPGLSAAPAVAFYELRKVSTELGTWDAVQKGFMAELSRITTLQMMGDAGWETIPLETVKARQLLDAETLDELYGQLVFFTCCCTVPPRADRAAIVDAVSTFWHTQTTSLDSTEYRNSLPILTPESPAPTASALGIPS